MKFALVKKGAKKAIYESNTVFLPNAMICSQKANYRDLGTLPLPEGYTVKSAYDIEAGRVNRLYYHGEQIMDVFNVFSTLPAEIYEFYYQKNKNGMKIKLAEYETSYHLRETVSYPPDGQGDVYGVTKGLEWNLSIKRTDTVTAEALKELVEKGEILISDILEKNFPAQYDIESIAEEKIKEALPYPIMTNQIIREMAELLCTYTKEFLHTIKSMLTEYLSEYPMSFYLNRNRYGEEEIDVYIGSTDCTYEELADEMELMGHEDIFKTDVTATELIQCLFPVSVLGNDSAGSMKELKKYHLDPVYSTLTAITQDYTDTKSCYIERYVLADVPDILRDMLKEADNKERYTERHIIGILKDTMENALYAYQEKYQTLEDIVQLLEEKRPEITAYYINQNKDKFLQDMETEYEYALD